MHKYSRICTHIRIYASIYADMQAYTHICEHTRIYASIYAYMHAYTHICTNIRIYARMLQPTRPSKGKSGLNHEAKLFVFCFLLVDAGMR